MTGNCYSYSYYNILPTKTYKGCIHTNKHKWLADVSFVSMRFSLNIADTSKCNITITDCWFVPPTSKSNLIRLTQNVTKVFIRKFQRANCTAIWTKYNRKSCFQICTKMYNRVVTDLELCRKNPQVQKLRYSC